MKKIEFSEEDCGKIVDMYKSGISAVSIGKLYGCSKNPITKVLHNYGIELDTVLRKVPREEYQNIVELYHGGKTQKEISEMYNCSETVICGIMKKLGVSPRPNGYTYNDARKMYEMYQDGSTLNEIAVVYNTDRHTVGRVLKRNNFVIDRKTYHCDEHYFDQIDSIDKAYILGLLWADGHNDVSRGKIILQLQEKDKELLESINKIISSDRPLWFCPLHTKNKNWSNTYTLTLQSDHISNVLESYGMVQRKSLVLEFPDVVKEDLFGPFIRGYVDGDGSICFNDKTKKTEVSMVGTEMFLKKIKEICSNLGIKSSIYDKNKGNQIIKTLHITNKKDRVRFLNWIYDRANLKMERKYLKYQQLLNDYNINNSLID